MKFFGKQKSMQSADTAPSEQKQKKKKRGKKKWIVLAVVVVLVVAILLGMRSCTSRFSNTAAVYTYAQAEKRDITSTLSGSGALEPADSYTVISLVSGEILSANFSTGDVVAKDDVLYAVDSSDAATSIEKAEISLAQNQRSYNNKIESRSDLTSSAPISGVVTGLAAEVGQSLNANEIIATIENTSMLTLTEYYSDEYSGTVYAGMPATVSVADQMLTLNGSVKEVSTLGRTSETGVSCFAVTVQVENPGALTVGTTATCWLEGNIYPTITDDDGLDAAARTTVYCKVSGTVADVRVQNNETVSAGQTILVLSSDTLSDDIQTASESLRDAELSLKNQYDALDNYTICAPIEGTIVDKYYKEGENAETGKTLCTIFDLSSLTLTLNVDELDIGSVTVGQTATITADAVPGKSYEGVITEVGINGTSSDGVTTYPVTIRIDETDGLRPGLNVDVSIIVSEDKGVLAIPADAVATGDRVLVKTEDNSTGEGAPEGYAYVSVETGVSDEEYVEILSGLSDGDEIAWMPETASSTSGMMAGMGGGPMGGGPMDGGPVDGGQTGGAPMGDGQTGGAPGRNTSGGN